MKKIFPALFFLVLMACSQESVISHEIPEQIVYRTQGYYNAAVLIETAYDKLPACGKPESPILCADAAVKKKVRMLDDAAFIAIKEAQTAVRTPDFGESKISTFITSAKALTNAFTEVVSTLPKKE